MVTVVDRDWFRDHFQQDELVLFVKHCIHAVLVPLIFMLYLWQLQNELNELLGGSPFYI